jgi:hypothetical protein
MVISKRSPRVSSLPGTARAGKNGLTEALRWIAATPPVLPVRTELGAVCVWVMFVSDFIEEMNLCPIEEDGSTDTVDGCVAPTLEKYC